MKKSINKIKIAGAPDAAGQLDAAYYAAGVGFVRMLLEEPLNRIEIFVNENPFSPCCFPIVSPVDTSRAMAVAAARTTAAQGAEKKTAFFSSAAADNISPLDRRAFCRLTEQLLLLAAGSAACIKFRSRKLCFGGAEYAFAERLAAGDVFLEFTDAPELHRQREAAIFEDFMREARRQSAANPYFIQPTFEMLRSVKEALALYCLEIFEHPAAIAGIEKIAGRLLKRRFIDGNTIAVICCEEEPGFTHLSFAVQDFIRIF